MGPTEGHDCTMYMLYSCSLATFKRIFEATKGSVRKGKEEGSMGGFNGGGGFNGSKTSFVTFA